jgi:hypothetical protein
MRRTHAYARMGAVEIINAAALTERFGEWPSFHDAEVCGLRLDSGQRSDGVVRLELDVHVFSADGTLPNGRVNWVNHTLVTLEFEDVEALEIDCFGPQNVLDDLLLDEVHESAGRQIEVALRSNNGLGGGFRCCLITMLNAIGFAPGPHSVYGT